ncbi:hypothetical protein D3C86_2038140 [compost metagenome]
MNENRISNCSFFSSTVSSVSLPEGPCTIGIASGKVRSPFRMRPMIKADLLRKNSDDSVWTWKFGAMRRSPKCSLTARTT